ncbi:Structural protein [Pseudomonas sp. IT-P258]
MQGKSITLGWDAVVFMNRVKVNSLMEQQYITRFNQDSFMKQIFGAPAMTPDGAEVLELSGLILSQPRLSFEKASLRDSRVTATMDIVSGTVSYVRKGSNQVPGAILYSYVVSAHQGYTVTMDIDLAASKGTVNEQGQVTVDIGDGYNCRCNLVNEEKSQELLGDFFKALFLEQKPEDRVYTLGMLDLRDVDLLAPRSFMIRTMATEEGKLRTSDDYGEGAVVLLVRTKGNPQEGNDPAEGALDYLIPNDRDAQGKAIYSGALVLASRVVFDWYIQNAIETLGGNGLKFERLSDSDHVARSLIAIAGTFNFDGFQFDWVGPHVLRNNGPLFMNMYNSNSEEALKVCSDGKSISISWVSRNALPFHYHHNLLWPWPDKDVYYDAYGMPKINVLMTPVLEERTNKVSFVRESEYLLQFNGIWEPSDNPSTNPFPTRVQNSLDEILTPLILDELETFAELVIPEINVLAISNLLFPERNALQLTEARLPGDLALFGHIDPKETTFTLDPLMPVIKAGEKQTFTIRQLGIKAADVTWSVRSVDGARALGSIDAGGEYTAPEVQLLESTAARNVVTATYTDPATGNEVTASALVTVALAGVVVTPSMAQIDMTDSAATTVTLKATTLGAGTLKWSLRGNQGSLSANQGREVTYTRPQTPPSDTLETVLIDVEDSLTGDKAIATVLLLNGSFSLAITPAFVPGVRANGRAFFKGPEDASLKWSVVAGEGQVNPDTGEFTAPSVITQPYSVVKGTLAGVVSGYSIIHLNNHAQQSDWFAVDTFDFTVETMPTRVWANGLQQARVVVRFSPTDYTGAPDPLELSDAEYKSIRLVSAYEKNPLPEVGEGGVPEGGKWYVTETENGYRPHPDLVTAQPTGAGQTREANMYIKEFFVQCHKVENLMVSATIRSDSRETFYSNPSKDDGEHNHKTRNLIAVAPPDGGVGGQVVLTFGDNPATRVEGGADEDDMNTTDYYYLKLMIKGVQEKIKDIQFVGNSSMIKWESDTQLEDIYSITGYALPDVKNAQGQQILHIDDILLRRLGDKTQSPLPFVNPGYPVPEGQVLFSLHRREYYQYDRYAKADFDAALHVIVIDVYGNKHSVRIGFDGTNRNKLKIIGS